MIGKVLLGLTVGLALAFCLLVAKGLWQWRRGWWRWAMAVPLLLMVGAVGNIAIGIALDPTSHNLWPFEVLIWLVAAIVVGGLLYLARWLRQRDWQHPLQENSPQTNTSSSGLGNLHSLGDKQVR